MFSFPKSDANRKSSAIMINWKHKCSHVGLRVQKLVHLCRVRAQQGGGNQSMVRPSRCDSQPQSHCHNAEQRDSWVRRRLRRLEQLRGNRALIVANVPNVQCLLESVKGNLLQIC